MFAMERFIAHSKSRDYALEKIKDLNQKALMLHEVMNYPINELEFFEDCAKEIATCRQVIKWTYVLDYYTVNLKDHERELFKF